MAQEPNWGATAWPTRRHRQLRPG